MTIQEEVLSYLLNHPKRPVSGQKLAERLGVSRNAVWKAVQNLRAQGYDIHSLKRQGYQLKQSSRQLDAVQIKEGLKSSRENLQVMVEETVTSTNDLAKQYLIDHPHRDVLIAANNQTEGRGRRGKTFYSELDEGLYFSLGFHPKTEDTSLIPLYTVLAASALVEALKEYVDGEVQIKWVNDLFYKGRKISGILSEVTSDLESGGISGIIIGIGLNLSGDFSQADREVREVAGSLFGTTLPKDFNPNQLLTDFLTIFFQYENSLEKKSFLPVYENHLLGIGKEVTYKIKNHSFKGIIKGIDQDAHLIIEKPDGELETLVGQEISFTSRQFTEREDGK